MTLTHVARGLGAALLALFTATAVFAQSHDLHSTVHSVTATTSGLVRVGDSVRVIRPGQTITPAELLALNQVAAFGKQSLSLSVGGGAVGGTINLNTALSGSAGDLAIPAGVNALGDFGKMGGVLNIGGRLINNGNLYAYSTNANIVSAAINAVSITNNANALISTVVPTGALGIVGALTKLGLNLSADDSITNSGVISSSGSLGLSSGSGRFANTGLIEAAQDINIRSNANIVFQNGGGTISSPNGAINFRDAGYRGSSCVSVLGGDWLSRDMNVFSGSGSIDGLVSNVTGILSTSAGALHLAVSVPILKLGATCISGDPTFANVAGSIQIDGNVSVQEDLTIISRGDITAPNPVSIVAATTGGAGHNITLIAGAQAQQSGLATTTLPGGTPVTVDVLGPAGTNGSIVLAPGTTIDASAQGGDASAGRVQLISYGGTVGTSSLNYAANITVSANGSNLGAGGNITAIGKTICLGNVSATAGISSGDGNAANGGDVLMATAMPATQAGAISFGANGSQLSGSAFSADLSTLATGGSIVVASVATSGGSSRVGDAGAGGSVTLYSNKGATVVGNLSTVGGSFRPIGSVGRGGNGGAVAISAVAGGASVGGVLSTWGGNGAGPPSSVAASGTNGTGQNGQNGTAGSDGGNGGAITLTGPLVVSITQVDSWGGNGGVGQKGGQGGSGANGASGATGSDGGGAGNGGIGGNGVDAGAAGTGGNGGNGGKGGDAGSITINAGLVRMQGGRIFAFGGNGAQAGDGGDGGAGGTGGRGGDGGPGISGGDGGAGGHGGHGGSGGQGGVAGSAGAGGTVVINSLYGDVSIITGSWITTHGGFGWDGGAGGNAGIGGAGGAGGGGGSASSGVSGSGGHGGDGASAGVAGNGGSGSNGGMSGAFLVNSLGGNVALQTVVETSGYGAGFGFPGGSSASGGAAGAGGASAATGGSAGLAGLPGAASPGTGASGSDGIGAQPGAITINSTGNVRLDGMLLATADQQNPGSYGYSVSAINSSAGDITVSGTNVAFQFSSMFSPQPPAIANIFGGRNILITSTQGTVTNQTFDVNLDLTSTVTTPIALSSSNFVVGQPVGTTPGSHGATFGFKSSSSGSVTINTVNGGNSVFSGSFMGDGTIKLADNKGGIFTVANGAQVTPAQRIYAIEQSSLFPLLTLNPNGTANGGTLTLDAQNVPAGGFSALNIPAGVIMHVFASGATSDLQVNGPVQINGQIWSVNDNQGLKVNSAQPVQISGLVSANAVTLTLLGNTGANISGTFPGPNGLMLAADHGAVDLNNPSVASLHLSATDSLTSSNALLNATFGGAMNVDGVFPGTVNATTNNGDLTLGSVATALSVQHGGTFRATNGLVIANMVTSDGGNVTLKANQVNVLGLNVGASGSVSLVANPSVGQLTVGPAAPGYNVLSSELANIVTGSLIFGDNSSAVPIVCGSSSNAIDFGSVQTELRSSGSIAVLNAKGASFTVVSGDVLTVSGSLQGGNGIVLNANSIRGNGTLNASLISLTAGVGGIGTTAGFLGVNGSVSTSTTGPVFLLASENTTVSGAASDYSVQGTKYNLGSISATKLVAVGNQINFVNAAVSAGSVLFSNQVNDGSGVQIIGQAQINTSQIAAISNPSPSHSGNGLRFGDGANPSSLNVTGSALDLLAVDGNVTISKLASVTSNVGINIFAKNLVLQGTLSSPVSFTTTGSTGTIVNPTGDVVLPKSLQLNSKTVDGINVAIIACGNITAQPGATSINLSNKFGNGGNLTMLAGCSVDASNSTGVPTPGTFTVTGFSTSGGSILLPKLNINTSTSFGGTVHGVTASGGEVVAIAHGSATNAGIVSLGTISTTGLGGKTNGGSVLVIGDGGIQTGSINTMGASGGAVTLVGGTPAIGGGTASVVNGALIGTPFSASVSPDSGAAIAVKGTVATGGSAGHGGAVILQSDQQVTVSSGINSSGTTVGGAVDLSSARSGINTGSIVTSGLSGNFAGAAGNGGDITLVAQAGVSTGSIIAIGGNNAGKESLAAGGIGGNVSVLIQNDVLSSNQPSANIKVLGNISTRGGNGGAAGNGGNAGQIALTAGSITVSGSGTSIDARGGSAGKSATQSGVANNISIHTFGTQAVTSLDLSSTKALIPATPGAMLQLGRAEANGIAGAIVADVTVDSKTVGNSSGIKGEFFDTAGGAISPGSGKIHITVDGLGATPVDAQGKRFLLSPIQALGTRTSSGVITVDQSEIAGTKYGAVNIPSGIILNVLGARPYLSADSTVKVDGELEFRDVSAGKAAAISAASSITVAAGGKIGTAGGDLLLVGKSSSDKFAGAIQVENLVLARSVGSAYKLDVTAGAGSATVFVANGHHNTFNLSINSTNQPITADRSVAFGDYPVATLYGDTAALMASDGNVTGTGVLSATLSKSDGTAGHLKVVNTPTSAELGTISITALTSTVSKTMVPTDIEVQGNITALSALAIKDAAGKVSFATGAVLNAGKLVSPLTNSPGAFQSLAPLAAKGAIASAGSISVSARAIDVADGANFTSNGGSITMAAQAGDFILGVGNNVTAFGGNVYMLSKANLTGSTANVFQALGVAGAAVGGVELGAGTTTSTLSAGFGKHPVVQPAIMLGSNIGGTNNGVVLATNRAAVSNISFDNSILNLARGVIVINNAKASTIISLPSSIIQTNAAKPVCLVSPIEDFVVETEEDDADEYFASVDQS